MVTSLLDEERIQTTDAKAKEVRRLADRMITLGKRGDLHARRRALRVIRRREVAAKVFDNLAERYRDRPGGYTRVLKLGHRVGDAAPISIVELVDAELGVPRARSEKKAAAGKGSAKKVAPEKAGSKKKTAKKTGANKQTSKKTAAKKTTAKKTSARKTTSGKKRTRKKSV